MDIMPYLGVDFILKTTKRLCMDLGRQVACLDLRFLKIQTWDGVETFSFLSIVKAKEMWRGKSGRSVVREDALQQPR